jgi:FAD/FMN-containing dehydrogenase
MDVTAKQRKILLACIVIIVGYYIARFVIVSQQRAEIFRQAAMAQQQAIQRAAAQQRAKAEADAKARAAIAASTTATTAAIQVITPNSQALTTLTNMAGIWEGQAALDGRGACRGRLEMHPAENSPGAYTGYFTLSCTSANPLMSAPNRHNAATAMKNNMDPAAAILSGHAENGSVHLTVEKTVGTDINGCTATSFTLTPFGVNRLTAQWQQSDQCPDEEMLMGRAWR